MKVSIARRLADLERRRESRSRQIHIIKGSDQADLDRQVAQLMDSGAMKSEDGQLCLTGRPWAHSGRPENTGQKQTVRLPLHVESNCM